MYSATSLYINFSLITCINILMDALEFRICFSLLLLGAHFLEVVVKKFDEFYKSIGAQRDKCCYNSVLVIAYLYNYIVSLQ